MEKEEKNEREAIKPAAISAETELMLQWGNRKRVRCVRVNPSNTTPSRLRRKTFPSSNEPFFPQSSTRLTRNSELATVRSENGKSSSGSPERHYTTRGSVVGLDANGKSVMDDWVGNQGNNNSNCNNIGSNSSSRGVIWPKICITLSSKEKEEDFMAMKGCKLPQRPKKRAKVIQRTLFLVSPGAWLTDMSLERYEVREKKSSKKGPRGRSALALHVLMCMERHASTLCECHPCTKAMLIFSI